MDGNCYANESKFFMEEFINDLRELSPSERALVVGPPALMLEAANAVQSCGGLALPHSSLFLTIGGWKRAKCEIPSRDEFRRHVIQGFGILDAGRVRDSYNMVELNSVLFECEAHQMHCPPWLFIDARDPCTLEPTTPGNPGVLAFLDPTPTSYPGFILADDFGNVVRNYICPCGRITDVLQLERRINRVESRGCALKIDVQRSVVNAIKSRHETD